MNTFYQLLANTILTNITNMTIWFALTYYMYLQTRSVLATGILSGIYLVAVAVTGFWFGSIVDHHRKKQVMLVSSIISLLMYLIGFLIYSTAPLGTFAHVESPLLWTLTIVLLSGVIAGNLRGIALPTLVTILVPEKIRDKANGMVGTANGTSFLIVSVISGFLVSMGGMYYALIVALICMMISIIHLFFITVPEKRIVHISRDPSAANAGKGMDIRGTIRVIAAVPGLFGLILFTTFNNFLGGVFMALMDAYGLSLVSVEIWGLLWGFLSIGFIIGGLLIAKFGLGKQPLRTLFLTNIIIWSICCIFTIQPWLWLLIAGCMIYITVVPYIEASEQTIIQKVVPHKRQGRVFGFAQSVEQAASPLTAFAIGPITQLIFIPFMTTGKGVQLLGNWFGTGQDRGIALVFTLTGIIGLTVTLLAMRSLAYNKLQTYYNS